MNRNGFTIVELLITIGVMSLLIAAATPNFVNFYQKWLLDSYAADLSSTVRLAQNKSMTGEDDAVFSIHLVAGNGGSFTMFKGTDFAGRNVAYDEAYVLPSAFSLAETVTGSDLLFTRTEGSTTTTGLVTLTWTDGGLSHGISVNSAGTVDPF